MNVLIIGGGKIGTYLASLLCSGGHQVKIVELKGETVTRSLADLPAGSVIEGNGTEPNVLERAGIRQAQVVAAVTGADETNLVVMSLARFEFNVPRTIARVNHPKNAWMFTAEMGVDVALNPADLMAHLIAEEMSLGDMLTLLKIRRGQYSLVEESVGQQSLAAGKPVQQLDLPGQCVLVAVFRQGALLVPRGDLVLQPADEVLALVHTSRAAQLAAVLGRPDGRR